MSRLTWLNRCTRWTALVALVLATLAPSVAHALRHVRGEMLPWSQICTTTGAMRQVIVTGDDGVPSESRAHAFEQCVYCALQHGNAAPPPSSALPIEPGRLAQPVPALVLHAPRPLFAWSAAQPRAPPQDS